MITKLNVSSVLPLKYVGEKDVIRASPPLAPMGTPTVHTVCFGRPPQPPATRQQPTLARSLQKLSRCWYLALTASSLQTRKIPGIYLSVVGCNCIMWNTAAQVWSKLPNLVGLDVSRMEITPNAVTQLLGAPSLQVVYALNRSVLEELKLHETVFSEKQGSLASPIYGSYWRIGIFMLWWKKFKGFGFRLKLCLQHVGIHSFCCWKVKYGCSLSVYNPHSSRILVCEYILVLQVHGFL